MRALVAAAVAAVVVVAVALAGCGDDDDDAPPDAHPADAAGPDAAACVPANHLVAASLGAGWTHTLAVDGAGALFTWGANGNGQLGVGDIVDRSLAAPVAGTWRSIAGGSRHSCGVRDDGTLWCWGVNVHGQLGVGDTETRTVPTQVGAGTGWDEVVCGGLHTCARTATGEVWCWGANPLGQLGIGDVTGDQPLPQRVGADSDWIALAARARHTCGLRADHTLWCWGDNSDGQVGQGDAGGTYRSPRPVAHPDLAGWAGVGTGAIHTCAIDVDGRLFCWGDNQQGKLGLGDADDRALPAPVGVETDWEAVRGGWSHTCALRAGGELRCFGANQAGQLGLGDTVDRDAPAPVGGGPWSGLAVGGDHTCALAAGGVVSCWGANDWSQLGDGTRVARDEPGAACVVSD
jgi:alpha-tubulin suppressor-like RCC1 family protein